MNISNIYMKYTNYINIYIYESVTIYIYINRHYIHMYIYSQQNIYIHSQQNFCFFIGASSVH